MSQKTICFYPTNQKRTNHFLFNLSKLLEASGNFKCVGYKDIKKESPKRIFSADIYHINWFDQSKDVVSFLKRLYFLVMLKLKGKKIVWTIHNIVSHTKTPFYNKILFALLVRFSDAIHIMCRETVPFAHLERFGAKVRLIPHGDYYGSYPEGDFDVRKHYGIESDRPIFLFMGAVQPYKNIEVLVRAFREAFGGMDSADSPVLLVCGKVEPDSYKATITELVGKSGDVVFSPEFIPDEHLASYLRAASILVAPYSYRSSLNSGTIPLAFTFGKTLICPDIPCVKDIVAECDCLYSYHYANTEEHVKVLSEKMLQAMSDMKSGLILEKMALAADYMKRNSWEAHRTEWIQLYGGSPC